MRFCDSGTCSDGLQDEGVAADDGERQEPQRHHRREVERGDRGADADRLAHRDAVDAAGDVLEAVAHQHRRRAARDLDALDAAAKAAARLVERLAVLGGDDAGDLVEVLFEQLLELEHRLRARVTGGVSLHAGNAAAAALTAASTSAFGASGVRAMTLPRAGLWTGTKSLAADGVQRPPMKWGRSSGSAMIGSLYSVGRGPDLTAARPSSRDSPRSRGTGPVIGGQALSQGNVAEFARVTQQSPADGRRLMFHATHYVIRGGIHGRERLRVISRIMHPTSSSLLDRLELHEGLVCADFGCGGGDLTVELARRVGPTGKAFGFDIESNEARHRARRGRATRGIERRVPRV